jgi:hypothetical protein
MLTIRPSGRNGANKLSKVYSHARAFLMNFTGQKTVRASKIKSANRQGEKSEKTASLPGTPLELNLKLTDPKLPMAVGPSSVLQEIFACFHGKSRFSRQRFTGGGWEMD